MHDRQNRLFFFSRRQGDLPPLIRVEPRTFAYFAVILVLVGLAGWLYLQQASQVALHAHEIRQIQQHKERLRREIIALRAEVAQYGALERIAEAAQTKGYSLPSATERSRLVLLEVPMAAPTGSPEPGRLQAAPNAAGPQPGFWQHLLEQFRSWLTPSEQGYLPAQGWSAARAAARWCLQDG
jgi:hypothetical protein